jgi:hypothetical protein
MGLKNIVNYTYRMVTQNRLALIGTTCLAVSGIEALYRHLTGDSSMEFIGNATFWGCIPAGLTGFGIETPESYDLTKNHIGKEGGITPEWIKPKLEDYCVRQGVYLACRDTNNLGAFNKACELEDIIIPNF